MSRPSHRYRAFGLGWQSALMLPELRPDPNPDAAPDVEVVLGAAAPPDDLPEVVPHVRADARSFWMEVPGLARFAVTGGRHVVAEPAPGRAEGDVRAFLLGTVVGAILHQRGMLALHASAVAVNGRAVAFVAPSGAGKSTLAMHLQHLGHPLVADDVCAIEMVDERPRLWPGLRNLKLWRASLEAIDRTPDGLEPVVASVDKYRMPAASLADYRPFELAGIVELAWGEAPSIAPLAGGEAVGLLVANTFRGQLVPAMGREAGHWRQCIAVAAAGVHRLTRTRDLDRLGDASWLVVERFSATDPAA